MKKGKSATPVASKPRAVPTCECCGSTEDVYVSRVNALCEDCESEHVYCKICDEWHSQDSECRHVAWTDCGYTGAGATDGLRPEEMHKEGVFLFFDLLDTLQSYDGDNLARATARAIRAHAFITQLRGFMLSTPDLYLKERRFYRWTHAPKGKPKEEWLWSDFGEVRPKDFEEERKYGRDDRVGEVVKSAFDEKTLTDGFTWLSTLDDDTKEANRLTVRWYRQWKADRDAGRRPLPAGRTRVPDLAKLPERDKPRPSKDHKAAPARRKRKK